MMLGFVLDKDLCDRIDGAIGTDLYAESHVLSQRCLLLLVVTLLEAEHVRHALA